MPNSLALAWDLLARDNASPTFLRVSAAADKAAASTEAAATKTEAASGRINRAIKTLAVGAVAGVAALGIESLKMAANFQTSTTRLVTSANESKKNLKMVQQGILDLSGQVGDSAEELSAAMYKVESGGQHGAAGLEVLKAAAQGAKAENADLTTVADALTSVLQDYHLKASASADVTSKLVAATASGKMTFEELAGSLSAILPLASANHVALNDVLGDLASMTIHGMSAEQASQNLADALRHLAAPTQMQSKELAALGISATQLSASLGQKGVYGTIQMVAAAIQDRLGPGTQQIVLNLSTALEKLPPAVQKLGKEILSGTISLGDYRKAMKALPAEQAVAAQSFMALVSSTHQLGTQTKSGAEVYQSYSGAMRQALGDATGMNVALMLTGENSKTTATAIGNVSKATADAHGNVKGWDEIQSTFNVRLQEFGQTLESDTIRLGEHLLPAATDFVSMLSRDAIPAIEHTASGLADAGHWFSQLPTPIRDTALAIGALGLSKAIGLSAALTSGMTRLATSFTAAGGGVRALGDEMVLQARLQQMEAASIAEVDAALGGLSVGASTVAGSLTAAQLSMRGWDAALAETVVEEDAATASTVGLGAAMATLAIRTEAAATAGISRLVTMLGGPWVIALAAAGAAVYGLVKWLNEDNNVIPKVTVNTQALTQAIEANSGAIDDNVRRTAAESLQKAGLFKAAQQWGVSLSTLTDAALGNQVAIQKVTAAAEAYKQKQLDAAHSTAAQSDQTGIATDAYERAAMQSDSWAKALGVLTNSTDNQIAKSKQINQAVGDTASAQAKARGETVDFAAASQKMGADVSHVWANNTVVLSNATGAQIKDLRGLGATITNLPNHQVVVSASTKAARDAINKLTADYHNYSINLGIGGVGATLARAAGGPIFGPGNGTSDSIPVMASNGEHMWTAREVAAAGGHGAVKAMRDAVLGGALHRAGGGPVTWNDMFLQAKVGISAAAISAAEQSLRSVGSAGSPGNVSGNAALGKILAGYRGWGSGVQWNDLYALWQRESGWNNNAQNPTSTAYGIPQFLNSTWASTGYPKTSDAATQIAAGLSYIASRYGSPAGAWAHEMSAGWYDGGGYLMPGATMAFNGTGKPERVRTAAQESALQGSGLTGLRIVGTLDLGNGLEARIDGRIDQALGNVHDLVHYG